MSRSAALSRLAAVVGVAVLAAAGTAGTAAAAAPGVGDFPHPLRTDARFFPLRAGDRLTYHGTIVDADGTHTHDVIFTVTDLVKKVGGVDSRVIEDVDVIDGVRTEAELTFFAQDAAADVWTRGEYPEEYDNGTFTGAPNTWISGVRRASAGILVPGDPRTGTPRFVQGRAPAIDFFDVGKVVATGLRVCAGGTCYDGVVRIQETAPQAPEDGFQDKFYAPGVGLVKVTAEGGDSRETLALGKVEHLSPGRRVQAVVDAYRLEARAYAVSADYRTTAPAHL